MSVSRPQALVLLLVTAAALLIAGAAVLTRSSSQDAIELRLPDAASATPSDGEWKVYVAGAVQRPGVYRFRPGDRVADAIEAAGGPTEDADLPATNLARRLRDEDRVLVPRKGEPPAVGTAGTSGGTATGGRLDLNTAGAPALEALPGIGPTRAQHIIESRGRDGPFLDPSDLVKRKLVPQSVYEGLKDLVDARP